MRKNNNTVVVCPPEVADDANHNNQPLAEIYPDLVGDWDKRWEAEGAFLMGVLDETRDKIKEVATPRVFEAAVGTGLEVVMLTRDRVCDITGNELDPYLLEIAKQNFTKEGVDIDITQHKWEDLDQYLPSNFYNLLLCLGNSFSYLPDEASQIKSLKSFRNLIDRRGRIIIDIRNWEAVIESTRRTLESGERVSEENCPIAMGPMYNGIHVKGFPIKISDTSIQYQYTDNRTGNAGYLTMSTLRHEDMMSLFDKAGFRSVETYSDFQKGLIDSSYYRQYVLGD